MEFHNLPNEMSASTNSIFALLLFICGALVWIKISSSREAGSKRLPPLPEAAGSWPLIGHLHLLGGTEPLHQTLSKISDKCGPIFMIRLGVRRAVVVSNWKIAKECLGTHDKVFVDRPKTVALEYFSYNYAMLAFAPHGPYWREVRRFVTVELLSNHRLESYAQVRVSEVRTAIESVRNKWIKNKDASGKLIVDMKQWFADINMNIILRIIVGKSLRELSENERDRCQRAIRGFFEFAAVIIPADALPFLRWLDIGSHEKAIKRAAQELDDMVQSWLEEHKRDRSSADVNIKQDFMDVMLEALERPNSVALNYDADTIIKATCLIIILGGSGTSSVILTWALSLLLNNRHVLKKAKDELDYHVGRARQVHQSDLKNLVYLQAVLKETIRLYPAAPLAIPHEAITDCCVSGYHIPAGTRLFINLHKIHRDPDMWSDPCEFCPERFLTSHRDVDVRGQNFELMPFGSGRRMCPAGISFAIPIMELTLATLLHNFELGSPFDKSVDMTEGCGLTNLKASALDVALSPCLPENIYNVTAWE